MVFSSLIFLFVFFPLNMLLYYLAKDIKAKNIILLVFSLAFYTWGEPVYVLLLLIMSLSDWILTTLMQDNRRHAKVCLVAACVVNLSILGVFKYGTFFMQNFKLLTGFPSFVPQIALPIGISFYTFQLLSYVVDVYKGEVEAPKKYTHLLLYVSLYHQCIAGPIVRYSDVSAEILSRKITMTDVSDGINRFVVGLGKKVLLANACGAVADALVPVDTGITAGSTVMSLWFGMLMYSLQIYLDFSAYSDMAIGMGRMTGFHYRENFNYPYMSQSVTEFWRRWHISLGSFFRDYVYIPLGGNRKGKARTFFNLFVVWFLTGMWHGASWNFILWGLYFFVFISLEKLFLGKVLKKLPGIVSNIYLLLVVYFGWVLFRFKDFGVLAKVLSGMFGGVGSFTDFETNTAVLGSIFLAIAAITACYPLVAGIGKFMRESGFGSNSVKVYYAVRAVAPVVIIFLSTVILISDSYNPFLYFEF